MKMKVAVIGAGRMGSIAAGQLPEDVESVIIDRNAAQAEKTAAEAKAGGWSAEYGAAADADVILLVLPTPAVAPAFEEAAAVAKPGAILVNMATKGDIPADLKGRCPQLTFADAKIIGHARSMRQGSPCWVVCNAERQETFDVIAHVLCGYANVVRGDSSLVPLINSIGSGEGVRAAVRCRKLLKQYSIPKEWEDIVIYTVCAGTMRSYVENDLGEFARKLADQMEAEEGI